jgi:hypothetical protein
MSFWTSFLLCGGAWWHDGRGVGQRRRLQPASEEEEKGCKSGPIEKIISLSFQGV